jgi:hypothetical protein
MLICYPGPENIYENNRGLGLDLNVVPSEYEIQMHNIHVHKK